MLPTLRGRVAPPEGRRLNARRASRNGAGDDRVRTAAGGSGPERPWAAQILPYALAPMMLITSGP